LELLGTKISAHYGDTPLLELVKSDKRGKSGVYRDIQNRIDLGLDHISEQNFGLTKGPGGKFHTPFGVGADNLFAQLQRSPRSRATLI